MTSPYQSPRTPRRFRAGCGPGGPPKGSVSPALVAKINLFEKVLSSALFSAWSDIYLAFFQALEEFFGWNINQGNSARTIKEGVRYSFPNPYARYASNYIIQAFNVLYIYRRIDIDPLV